LGNGFKSRKKIPGGPDGGRFGFSLANLGDVDNDGFMDFAVGAPFEQQGAIYIYKGSKDFDFTSKNILSNNPSMIFEFDFLIGIQVCKKSNQVT